jgi:hypothetical protein
MAERDKPKGLLDRAGRRENLDAVSGGRRYLLLVHRFGRALVQLHRE